MPDHWAYVFAAYAFATVVLVAYWRHLARRERELSSLADRSGVSRSEGRTARISASAPRDTRSNPSEPRDGNSNSSQPGDRTMNSMNRNEERSRVAPGSGHLRSAPASRPPLQ